MQRTESGPVVVSRSRINLSKLGMILLSRAITPNGSCKLQVPESQDSLAATPHTAAPYVCLHWTNRQAKNKESGASYTKPCSLVACSLLLCYTVEHRGPSFGVCWCLSSSGHLKPQVATKRLCTPLCSGHSPGIFNMPSATIDSHGVSGVAAAAAFLDNLLARAEIVKQTASIEPPLEKSDFDDVRRQLSDALNYEFVADEPVDAKRLQRFAVIETAARDTFKSLIVSWSQNRAFPPPFGAYRWLSSGNNAD